jgi:hypothetical protein
MAIGTTDRDLLITTLFEMAGEDPSAMGRILARLEVRFPAIAWRARGVVLARTHQPFIDAGLSIDWWTAEVGRYADGFK